MLSEVYLREHGRTLDAIAARRRDEWAAVAGRDSSWEVEVVFVAHGMAHGLQPPEPFEVGQAHVTFHFVTYADMIRAAPGGGRLSAEVNRLVVGPLNELRTPDAVRVKCLSLLGGSADDAA